MIRAIGDADRILSWGENLGPDEMPPEWMYPLDFEIIAWFEEVEQRRKDKYDKPVDDRDEVPMVENDMIDRGRR